MIVVVYEFDCYYLVLVPGSHRCSTRYFEIHGPDGNAIHERLLHNAMRTMLDFVCCNSFVAKVFQFHDPTLFLLLQMDWIRQVKLCMQGNKSIWQQGILSKVKFDPTRHVFVE
jgi:hypothetical protein